MIRTEDDIRRGLDSDIDHAALARLTAFATQLDNPAEPDGLRPAAEPTTIYARRIRVAPLLAAAAAVAALALGAAWLETPRSDERTSASNAHSAEQRRPVWNLRIARVAGYTTTRVNASSIGLAGGSTTFLTATDVTRPERGVLTTCPGTLSSCAQPAGTAESVRVHGEQGFFTSGGHVGRGSLSPTAYRAYPWLAASNADNGPSLAWYAGHDTTVFLSGTFGFDPHTFAYDNPAAEKILLRIASATTAGHSDAAHLPFTLTGLPGEVAPESVRVAQGGACGGYGIGPRSTNDALGIVFTACRVTTGATSAATIAHADRVDSNSTNGTTHFETEQPIIRTYPDGTSMVIAVEPDQRAVSPRQAHDLAAHADVSPRLDDQSTWAIVD